MVEALVAAKADLNATDVDLKTPLDLVKPNQGGGFGGSGSPQNGPASIPSRRIGVPSIPMAIPPNPLRLPPATLPPLSDGRALSRRFRAWIEWK